jgi:hypothetical protein
MKIKKLIALALTASLMVVGMGCSSTKTEGSDTKSGGTSDNLIGLQCLHSHFKDGIKTVLI